MSSALASPAAAERGRPVNDTSTTSQDNSGADDFRQLFSSSIPLAQAFSATNPPLPYGYPDPSTTPASFVSTPASVAVSPAVSASASGPPVDASEAAFVPTFQTATVTDGTTVWPANSDYFASQQTAQWIANKYGTGQLVTTPFEGSGGPFSASASEYQIVLANGTTVNAGILASYYERNPESQFPGVADSLIRSQLGLG